MCLSRAAGYGITAREASFWAAPEMMIVRDNDFHTSGAAILVAGDAADWFESGATRHIEIRENRFDDCDHVKCWGQGVIQVDTPVREIRYRSETPSVSRDPG